MAQAAARFLRANAISLGGGDDVRKEVSPTVVWVVLGVLIVIVAVVGYKMFAPRSFKGDTAGSEQAIQNVKQGGTFYTPPAGAPVPGAGGTPTTMPSGYSNFQPPSH